TIFILRQLKLEEPMLEFRIFKYNIFTISTGLGMVVFMSMIGTAVILPFFMQNMLGFSAFESGLALLPGAIIMGLMNPITGRLFDLFGARWLSISGLFLLVVTTILFTNLSEETSFVFILVVNAARMLSIAMVMMPATTAGLDQLPQRLIPQGSALNNTMRQMTGANVTALLVTVMTSTSRPNKVLNDQLHGVHRQL